MADPMTLALVVLAGFAAGVASGLFGVGGGILMVPAAIYLLGTTFHVAKAASLVVIVVASGIGIWTHARRRSVDLRKGALLAAGGFAGTAASVFAVERVADATLVLAFGVVLALAGLRLALGGAPAPRAFSRRSEAWAFLGIGLAGGLLSGAFGIGGGILMVPAMMLVGLGAHLAVGTSLVAVLGNAASGTLAHLALDYGPSLLAVGVPLAVGAAPGTRVGSLLAHRLHADRLRTVFGAFLVLVGLLMALDALL